MYRFSNGTIYPFAHWECSNCVLLNPTIVGTEYRANVRFDTPGTATLVFKDNNDVLRGSININVIVPVPNTTFTLEPHCGSTVLARNTDPPSGVNWYWQTSLTGTSTSSMGPSLTINSTGTYYLRARWGVFGEWSQSALSTESVTVATTPPEAPATGQSAYAISNSPVTTTLWVSAVSGATSYKWFSAPIDGNLIATTIDPSYTVTAQSGSIQTYFVESSNGCGSASRREVRVEVYPEPIVIVTNNGEVEFSDVTMSVNNFTYDSYVWLDGSNDPLPGATTNSYTTSKPGAYSLRVTKSGVTFTTQATVLRSENYIVINEVLVPTTSETAVESLPIGSKFRTTQFFDGLGRVKQTVSMQSSPGGGDLVQPVVYDKFGREPVKYLPYVAGESTGWVKNNFISNDHPDYSLPEKSPQFEFYQQGGALPSDSNPYAQTRYEASPLDRVIKQGAPGEDWQPNESLDHPPTDRSVKFKNETNFQGEVILWRYANGALISGSSNSREYYLPNTLFKMLTKDEDHHEVIEFKDKAGKVVLKKVQAPNSEWAETYYIYDDFGNLVVVLSPEAVKTLN
jgi:hypothetical protein